MENCSFFLYNRSITSCEKVVTWSRLSQHFFFSRLFLLEPMCKIQGREILVLLSNFFYLWLFRKIFIYLFGCARSQLPHAGSSLLCAGSLLRRVGSYSCGVRGSFSCGVRDLVPWLGIEPGLPALGAQSPNHWTIREIPYLSLLAVWLWCAKMSFALLFIIALDSLRFLSL